MQSVYISDGNPSSGESLLEYVSDISLADVLAAHRRLKHDPEYRRREMPESALTPAERRDLERQRLEWQAGWAALKREEEISHPIGCGVDGFQYAPQWRVLRLYLPPRHKPDKRRTIAFATKDWPRVARIVCVSGDEPCMNYVRRGDEWAALRPGDADYCY